MTETLIHPLDQKPWAPLGEPGNFIKVLHVDEAAGQVVFVQRFAPGTQHPPHTHHCSAIAFTLSGEWRYGDEVLPAGVLGCEGVGTTHAPMTAHGREADVLVILTSRDGRFLEIHTDDGASVWMNIPEFRALMSPQN